MTHGSLFSGIGGFDLAAEWMGWENIFHCEWNDFGQKVLKYYWPKAISYHDITKTDFTIHKGRIDILTGGFPCQPYSLAGKRKGKEDERHLWPSMLRAIKEIQPRWVVGENVLGLVNWNGGLVFQEVQTDLEAAGYEVFPYVLPACAVNAPHRRDRVWFVAYNCSLRQYSRRTKQSLSRRGTNGEERDATYPDGNGLNQCNGTNEVNTSKGRFDALGNISQSDDNGDATDTSNERLERRASKRIQGNERGTNGLQNGIFTGMGKQTSWQNFPTQSPICTRNDGISFRLDSITFSKWRNESIKAAGNAIVPQVVYQIFKAIEQYEELSRLPNKV